MREQLYIVQNGSWALLDSGSGKMKPTTGEYLKNKEFRLLAEDCNLPGDDGVINTIVLREIHTNEILFTQTRFVEPSPLYCPTCGHRIKEEA